MRKKLRILFGILFSVMFVICCSFAACSCNPSDTGDTGDTGDTEEKYNGLFAATDGVYTLSDDYTISEEDVKNTEGESSIQLSACTFNLNGYTLDLNGYELAITSQGKEVVAFNQGTIKGGKLNISVPNGDIDFDNAVIDESVTYELEAASDTITFSNARLTGAGVVKSNTNVKVEYSSIADITLAGSGTLTAGSGAQLGDVTVGENASGAKVSITPYATVSSVAIQAAAEVNVAGSVSAVTVAEAVKNDNSKLTVNVEPTATVDKVELHAAAEVNVAGNVSAVTVAEAVKNDSATLTVNVAPTAEVAKVELKAAAAVTLEGKVAAVKVDEAVNNDTSAALTINVAADAEVTQVELKAKAQVEVSGSVQKVVALGSAQEASVKLNETAQVSNVVVKAEGVTVASDTAVNVVVADTVKSINTTVEYTTATEAELDVILAHEHIYYVDSTVPATCTEAGKKILKCVDDDDTKEEVIEALGHSNVYTIIKKPTAEEKGVGRFTCIRCGHTEDVEISNLSSSITLDGVNQLFALIPDGVYNISADSTDLPQFTFGNNVMKINGYNGVIKVVNGEVSGTIYFDASIDAVSSGVLVEEIATSVEASLKCIIKNDTMVVKVSEAMTNEDGEESAMDVGVVLSLSGLIKNGIISASGYDPDMLGEYLSYFGSASEEDQNTIIEKLESLALKLPDVKLFTTTTDKDGNTVNKLDVTELKAYVDGLGKKTPEAIVNELFGEGKYASTYTFLTQLPDMKVSDVKVVVDVFAGSMGLGDGQLYSLIEAVILNTMGVELDLDAMAEEYKDYTVVQVAAMLTGGAADETALNAAAESLKTQYLGTLEQVNTLLTKSTLSEVLAKFNFDFASIGAMIESVNSLVSLEYTTDAAGTVIAYSFKFDMDENTQVSIVKTVDKAVPDIKVNINGIVASVTDKGNDTIEATLSAFGMSGLAVISKTANDGVNVSVSVAGVEDNTLADVKIIIASTENGKKVTVDGKIAGELLSNGSPIEGAEPEDLVISGTIKVEKDNGAELDSDLMNEYKDLISPFYKTNFTLISRDYSSFYDLYASTNFKYGVDEIGENYVVTSTVYVPDYESGYFTQKRGVTYYYGDVTKITKTFRIEAVNGLPQAVFNYNDDCGDWVNVYFICGGAGTVTTTVVSGEFTVDGYNIFTAKSVTGEQVVSTEDSVISINGSCYFNLATGEVATQSQHKLTATAKLVEGATTCEDGMLVTTTCSECDYKNIYFTTYHYYENEYIYLPTQCGSNSHLEVRTCVGCGEKEIYASIYGEHSFDSSSYKVIITDKQYAEHKTELISNGYTEEEATQNLDNEYVILSDLPKELDVTGFYYGKVYIKHCTICGLNIAMYIYYTNTAADGCLKHEAYKCEYKGNEDNEGFVKVVQAAQDGHYYPSGSGETVTDVAATTAELEKIVGKLPFTPKAIQKTNYTCMGCDKLMEVWYNVRGNNSRDYIYIEIDYDSDGNITDWYYYGDIYSSTNVYKLYNWANLPVSAPFQGATYAYAYVSVSQSRINVDINLENDNYDYNLNFYDYGDYGDLYINMHDIKNCQETTTKYIKENGQWGTPEITTDVRHTMTGTTEHNGICTEDGVTHKSHCEYCDYVADETTVYNHNNWNYGIYEYNINNLAISTQLPGLSANVSCDWICGYDYIWGNCVIRLTDDWTLTQDVYFIAEGLTIDLNGYSIDLNGHTLALYSCAGHDIVITDSAYDTSNPEAAENSITDTAETKGLLVLFTNGGNITGGTITIEANIFTSDTDDRSTIAESVKNAENIGVDISALINSYKFLTGVWA